MFQRKVITRLSKTFSHPIHPYSSTTSFAFSPVGTALYRGTLLASNVCSALADPTRQDAVAAVGELTATPCVLESLRHTMRQHPVGRRILRERPTISSQSLPLSKLLSLPEGSFGREYGLLLKTHNISPDTRTPVRYISDPELAYIMLRYRQVHDFMHTLTGIPISVEAEIALKMFEFGQTGLPFTALSGLSGLLLLNGKDARERLFNLYLPWALRNVASSKESILNVYYEKELETPLVEIQHRLGIRPLESNHF